MFKQKTLWLIAASFCMIAALFFKVALIGYLFTALLFAGLGILCVLYAFLPKPWKKKLTLLVLVGAILFGAIEIPIVRASRGDNDRDADYLIVLGAGLNGSSLSYVLYDRLTAAKQYLTDHPSCIAVVTGGQGAGESVTEASAMYDWLVLQGIDPARIIMEERATNTEENLRFSRALIPDADSAQIAVLSSEFHLYRAGQIARRQGMTVFCVRAKTTLPILRINYFIREAFAMVKFWLFS